MKIMVLGAAGQLGRRLCLALPGNIVGFTRTHADLTEPLQLRSAFERHRPEVVVNAAGFTEVDRAEAEPAAAFAVNASAMRDLAILCRDFDCALIHFSTNYVFGAEAERAVPYAESDAPGPINVYGDSKLLGEEHIRSLWPRHFILRTAGLYGTSLEGSGRVNFVATMLRKARAGTPIRVVSDQICTPTSAADLADAVRELLGSEAYGLYHLTNAGDCSWHEFAQAIFALSGRPARLEPIRSHEYAALAARPRYSVLANARWIENRFAPLRPWREALAHYLAENGGADQVPA
jgi:dTDP-4-dehydrorhamnose reductase